MNYVALAIWTFNLMVFIFLIRYDVFKFDACTATWICFYFAMICYNFRKCLLQLRYGKEVADQ